MEREVIAGYQGQDVALELFFGKDHPVDSNETAIRTAGSMCFRNVSREANPVLLEPIVTAKITVPAEKLGDITSDLNGRDGRVKGMDNAPGGLPGDPRQGASFGNDDVRAFAVEHDGRPGLLHARVQPRRRRSA
jgi:translation elongation factor EF-G